LFNGFYDLFNDWSIDNFSCWGKGIIDRGGNYWSMGNGISGMTSYGVSGMTGNGISGMTSIGISGMTSIGITGMTGIGIRKDSISVSCGDSISVSCGKDNGKNKEFVHGDLEVFKVR
jgi:hypothetical protein